MKRFWNLFDKNLAPRPAKRKPKPKKKATRAEAPKKHVA